MKLVSQHRRSLNAAGLNIIKNPLEHGLNILVIAVIIAILSAVCLIGKNIVVWEKGSVNFPQIMVYLQQNAKPADISNIETAINKNSQKIVGSYQYISKEQGLSELQQDKELKSIASDVLSDMSQAVPDVLIVNTNTTDINSLTNLKDKIASLPMVDNVQMDGNYASKVSDLMSFVGKVTGFLEVLFTVVLILVIYNIIRLQMLLRQDEITVSRLIGASDSFIMRPLTYYALLQVVVGALIAFYLVHLFVKFVNGLFLSLNNLFGHAFLLNNLTPVQMAQMLAILIVFSIFAVFVAVQLVFKNKYTQ